MEMIDHVRSGGQDVVVVDDSQCEVLDPALLAEVENMFKDPLPDPSAILRQPTLMLGEPSVGDFQRAFNGNWKWSCWWGEWWWGPYYGNSAG